ncbi:site-specific integrase [Methylobacterium sp. Leaf465]|uniref:tyrosine-type recombinase/integrase n=1 Tax=Methylobacterium sp. Leaf465 TaxID=1736385 RepID=UPI0009E76F04|nr:site-specific integrase [Methylobacterium sp. Leaf465]
MQVRAMKIAGRYADGNGLYLIVDPSGAKRWLLRTVVQGRRRDIGLGGTSLVSLAEAREKASSFRKLAREGGDPLAERRKVQASVPTFAQAVQTVHDEHKATWKNAKHAQQWITTLQTYAYPHLNAKPVDGITTPDVLKVLAPIWLTKPETARRVRQRIGTVLDWAKAAGHRAGENPIDGVAKGLPKQTDRDEHHSALSYAEVSAFLDQLRVCGGSEAVRLGFEFLILTAARTGEVLGMTWSEIDMNARLWMVPAQRMKAGREHRVPLSDPALAVLTRAKAISTSGELVFPGRSQGRPLSNMAFLMVLRRMGLNITPHGFRSSFRDWAAECTSLPREVAEMALAHTVENRVEAAYRRGDLLEKRRELMMMWANWATSSV